MVSGRHARGLVRDGGSWGGWHGASLAEGAAELCTVPLAGSEAGPALALHVTSSFFTGP